MSATGDAASTAIPKPTSRPLDAKQGSVPGAPKVEISRQRFIDYRIALKKKPEQEAIPGGKGKTGGGAAASASASPAAPAAAPIPREAIIVDDEDIQTPDTRATHTQGSSSASQPERPRRETTRRPRSAERDRERRTHSWRESQELAESSSRRDRSPRREPSAPERLRTRRIHGREELRARSLSPRPTGWDRDYDKFVCKRMHPLIKMDLNYPSGTSTISCYVCGRRQAKSTPRTAWTWTCRYCSFDRCRVCANDPKLPDRYILNVSDEPRKRATSGDQEGRKKHRGQDDPRRR